VARSALLIDYVLTVAVSVTSGVAALTTALPSLQRFVLPLSLAAIVVIMWANLRGVRESGRIFAVPTYLFVGSCAIMLLVGLGRLASGHLDPIPAADTAPLPSAAASVGLLLVPHAFAAGCTALTGVEAISNGVPVFRPPEARNARRTLVAMGMILGSLSIGVSFLVANTSFADFPRLVSFAAADAVGARARPDTESTVLLPRHGDLGRFHRLLHDQTGRDLFAALNRLAGVTVAVVGVPARRSSSRPPDHPIAPAGA
jgi:amino acid transporter